MIAVFLNANGVNDYYKGNFDKAEKEFKKLLPNDIAKAYLAKIYFKKGEYKKAKNLWQELLKKNIPLKVKNEINSYLNFYKTKFKLNIFFDVGLLYDSNINNSIISINNNNYSKKDDFAHIEEAKLAIFYKKENIDINTKIDAQNRMYFVKSKYNKIITNVNFLSNYFYKNFIPFISIDYENLINKDVKNNDSYLNFKIGSKYKFSKLLIGANYFYKYFYLERKVYKHNGINIFSSFNNRYLELSVFAQIADIIGNIDGTNYGSGIHVSYLFKPDFNINVDYDYSIADYKNKTSSHLHSIDTFVCIKNNKHILYSFGLKEYYLVKKAYDLRKYEIYSKIIFKF